MTNTRRSTALAAAASALLCLATPHAQAAGPLFTAGGPVTAPGTTLITFGDGMGQSMIPPAILPLPAISPGEVLVFGFTDTLEPAPFSSAGLSPAKSGSRHNGLPGPPKTDFVPEPSETATLGLGGIMLGGLVFLARKRRTVRVF